MLDKVKLKLSGYKTYLLAGILIVKTVVDWSNGQVPDTDAFETIIEALCAVTIRSGIKNGGTK